MNKILYILFMLVGIVIIGFVAGMFLNERTASCTEMGCVCEQEGEMECNNCKSEDPIFALGVVNIVKVCDAKEILICKNNEFTGRTYKNLGICQTKVTWFDFVLDYME